jgi:hypothetical protein
MFDLAYKLFRMLNPRASVAQRVLFAGRMIRRQRYLVGVLRRLHLG